MKRIILCILFIFLLLQSAGYSEKTFEDINKEFDEIIANISECNEIIDACQTYLDIKAETNLDTPELKSARSRLQLLGVIPYKKYGSEISYVETALEGAQMKLEWYQKDMESNISQQSLYYAQAVKESKKMKKQTAGE